MVEQRTWGDGGGDRRAHVIEFISFARGIAICRCEHLAAATDVLSLDEVWAAHTGRIAATVTSQATDSEVTEFLDGILKERDEKAAMPLAVTSSYTREPTGVGANAIEDAFEWLTAVTEMRARCTCDTTPITECPNYRDGDDE